MINKNPLIILTGPTAVGKTSLSIELAKAIGGEIISADSMQIYKMMDIGTAKITKSEMDGIKHYLIDELAPDEEFNVTIFQNMAKRALANIYKKGKIPIIVGGTGFYIQALLYDIDFNQEEDEHTQYRQRLYELAKEKGNEYVHNMLSKVDEASALTIHPNNIKRVVRALEFYKLNGFPISEHNEQQKQKESPYNYLYFVLNDDRQVLYDRIDKRVDLMFEDGLVEEVKQLIDKGYTKNLVSMQGIGYKEMFGYFEKEYDLERAKYLIKLDTRHFAKRQITWFKREKSVNWIDYNKFNYSKENILDAIIRMAAEKGII